MFLINQAMVNVPIGTAALIVVLGMAVVFFGLILLMLVTKASGKIMQNKEAAAKAAAPAPAPAAPAAPAVKAARPWLCRRSEAPRCSRPDGRHAHGHRRRQARKAPQRAALHLHPRDQGLILHKTPRAPHNALCAVRFLSRFLYSAPVFRSASAKRVGGDAHIDPANYADFTEIQCEFAASLGAMWASPPTH